MRNTLAALALLPIVVSSLACAGEAEVKSAQTVIDSQLKAFSRNDDATAYSFAAPTIKQMFPTVEAFMGMVSGAYEPVHKPKSYSFGKSEEMGADSIMQQLIIVGPDGKDYEAMYSLQRQPDGSYLINGVSLKASNTLST